MIWFTIIGFVIGAAAGVWIAILLEVEPGNAVLPGESPSVVIKNAIKPLWSLEEEAK